MLLCAVHPGLNAVFMELLSLKGFAFRHLDAVDLGVVGLTVGDMRFRFKDAVVAGVADKRLQLSEFKPLKDQGILG